MKASTTINILLIISSILLLASVFAKPLGMPDNLEVIPCLMVLVCIYLAYRVGQKAKATGKIPQATISQKQKKLRVVVISCAAACIASPFVMPYTGVTLPFWELVIISITSFIMCTGIVFLTMKYKK